MELDYVKKKGYWPIYHYQIKKNKTKIMVIFLALLMVNLSLINALSNINTPLLHNLV